MPSEKSSTEAGLAGAVDLRLTSRPERRLIRPRGGRRHVYVHLRVDEVARPAAADRPPLTLALVVDRSGSMAGGKLGTAKRAVSSVLDRLDARDRVAVVVFDDEVDVLQAAAPVTDELRAAVRRRLEQVEARATTALHEGWLTGCRAIADEASLDGAAVARCFLLTDGLANVGETDPEAIAGDAAGIRRNAGIGTSTFGIGEDYDEDLLGPMAVAGGGQFHHLRSPEEIARTFVGELGGLLAVAAARVRLEIALDPGMRVEAISEYWLAESTTGEAVLEVGDLLAGEERHLVLRFGFPPRGARDGCRARLRAVWSAAGVERRTPWEEIRFAYAGDRECDAETRDAEVMHWVGLHHAERARQEAAKRNRYGDFEGAARLLERAAERIRQYAGDDAELLDAARDLTALEATVASAPLAAMEAKEIRYAAQTRSRGQVDRRGPGV